MVVKAQVNGSFHVNHVFFVTSSDHAPDMATSMSTVFNINNRISALVHEWSMFSAVFSCLPLSFMYTAETLHLNQSLLDLGNLPSFLHSVETAHGDRQRHSTTSEQCSNCLWHVFRPYMPKGSAEESWSAM